MNESLPDLNESEREFLREYGEMIQRARAERDRCPTPQLIMAAKGESLSEETRAQIEKHLAGCDHCRMLAEDMEAAAGELSHEEKARIRARLQPAFASPARMSVWGSFWNWALPAAVVAAVAVLAVVGINLWRARGTRQQPSRVAVQQSPSMPVLAALPLDKPGVPAPQGSDLIWRGGREGKGNSYQSQLDAALVPYSKSDYAAASAKLEQLQKKFPQRFEPKFYKGISLLFLNDASAAMRELEAANEVAPPPESYQAVWYLAVAEQRAGKGDLALSELQHLCKTQNPYSSRACEAIRRAGSQ